MIKSKIKGLCVVCIAAITLLSCACEKAQTKRTETFFAMDTVCEITVYENRSDFAAAAAKSISEAESAVTFGGSKSVTADRDFFETEISPAVFEMLSLSLEISRKTDGKYDPTVLRLTELWDIANVTEPPQESEIQKALTFIGAENIMLTPEKLTVKTAGVGVDIGSMGKGYAGDAIANALSENGFSAGIVNLGGNIRVFGKNPNKESGEYTIGIKDPNDVSRLFATVDVSGKNVVTSGSYERYFEYEGKKYHHIIDPDTGYPCDNGVSSVTIIAENGLLADILSTAVFVSGKDGGLALLADISTEHPDVAAIIIMTDGTYTTFNTDMYNFKLLS